MDRFEPQDFKNLIKNFPTTTVKNSAPQLKVKDIKIFLINCYKFI